MILKVVCHSGGFDSSLCLALAVEECGADAVISMGFDYGQVHTTELEAASLVAKKLGVHRVVWSLPCWSGMQQCSLINPEGTSSLVPGRNGMFAQMSALYAHQRQCSTLVMGVMRFEGEMLGYRDCNPAYIQRVTELIRLDLGTPAFTIETPLIELNKRQAMELAQQKGWLEWLWNSTISCYRGVTGRGCRQCPACVVRSSAYAMVTRQK